MFENGNYRRRRRMKRPYRTGAHFQKMFGDSYIANANNFAHRSVFTQQGYQPYPPRYDTGLVKHRFQIDFKLIIIIKTLQS